MPVYIWQSECGHTVDVYRTVARRNYRPKASEGAMEGAKYKRVIGRVDTPQKEYRKPIYSDAMAINPEDVAEHKRVHPNVPIMPDGRIGPINSHHQHQRVMAELGFVDRSGR